MIEEQWSWDHPEQKEIVVKQGQAVHIKHCWGFIPENEEGMTPAKDFRVCADEECTMIEAVEALRKMIHGYVQEHGGKNIRHYYIEDIRPLGEDYEIIYGT